MFSNTAFVTFNFPLSFFLWYLKKRRLDNIHVASVNATQSNFTTYVILNTNIGILNNHNSFCLLNTLPYSCSLFSCLDPWVRDMAPSCGTTCVKRVNHVLNSSQCELLVKLYI